ncbi:hypothetical protein ACFPRL_05185 [Pseudoclavibacter helvolus]
MCDVLSRIKRRAAGEEAQHVDVAVVVQRGEALRALILESVRAHIYYMPRNRRLLQIRASRSFGGTRADALSGCPSPHPDRPQRPGSAPRRARAGGRRPRRAG